MCKDCGCEQANQEKYFHSHEKEAQASSNKKILEIEQKVLQKNDDIAHQNRHWFDRHKIKVLNLMSSPGSGKTLLLEKTLQHISSNKKVAVLVGDQQTDHDAKRLAGKGAAVKQINTQGSCHLDAAMIAKELGHFIAPDLDLLIIENVGNLVCPAAFPLGEHQKIALLSVTEGEDKPAKYPVLFHQAQLVLFTKYDLCPYLDWDEKKCESYLFALNPSVALLRLSAKTGTGMEDWLHYLNTLEEEICV